MLVLSDDHQVFSSKRTTTDHAFKRMCQVSIYCGSYSYWCSNCPTLGHWQPLLADMSTESLLTSLLSGMKRWSRIVSISCSSLLTRLILYISCARPRISHFYKEPNSFWWKMVLEDHIQVLGGLFAIGCLFVGLFSG